MHFREPNAKKRKYIIIGAAVLLILGFVISFRKELLDVFSILWAVLKAMAGMGYGNLPDSAQDSFWMVAYNLLCGFGLVFILCLLLISSQALLPVSNLQEIQRTAFHLLLFVLRRHGPAVFVRDGIDNLTDEDKAREGPGVVVVDFNSAVVLEERISPQGLSRPFTKLSQKIFGVLGLGDQPDSPRACGPGIVFTRPRENIRGTVDLRPQFRVEPNITCYTREGIELSANVNAVFTIGQNPDVLEVTYVGDRRPENLRVISFSKVSDIHLRVAGIQDELDETDQKEIDHFRRVYQRTGRMTDYTPLSSAGKLPVFNQDRVFAAVFAQARNSKEELLLWSDLPTRVAAGFYREILSQINYDDLYDVNNVTSFPLPQYKRKLTQMMRNNGILSFRLINLKTNLPIEKNWVYRKDEFCVSEIRALSSSKILRDRGIKVIASSFGDLIPVSNAIYLQRLDHWRSKWEQELEISRASQDLQAMQVRSRAHAQAQRDLTFSLARIFELQDHSEEAIALRILQALERAAADPKTGQLLPSNTIDLIRTLHNMLLPNENPTYPPGRR